VLEHKKKGRLICHRWPSLWRKRPREGIAGWGWRSLSDGLTEDLIHALSLQSFYRVLSRNSTFAFKGQNLSTRLDHRRRRQADPRQQRDGAFARRHARADKPEVIGRMLTEGERFDLIKYLKTL
jgi:hypothetical protein